MKALEKIIKIGIRRFLDKGIKRYLPSAIIGAENKVQHNQFLVDIALAAINDANRNSLTNLATEKSHLKDSIYYDLFPGEHYRLLRSLVSVLGSRNIIEVGTFTGMGTVSLVKGMSDHGHVTTFDLIPWDQFDTHLTNDLFDKKKVTQILADLSEQEELAKHQELISRADLIFCDAPKDGVFEYKFLDLLTTIKFESKCLLILDDIRFLNMISLWWSVESPKLDLTSFGHWSGTGLVDISEGLKLR